MRPAPVYGNDKRRAVPHRAERGRNGPRAFCRQFAWTITMRICPVFRKVKVGNERAKPEGVV